jgi:hypothetical protein
MRCNYTNLFQPTGDQPLQAWDSEAANGPGWQRGDGFCLRKSFKVGPLRLNLSKSGLGASVGR